MWSVVIGSMVVKLYLNHKRGDIFTNKTRYITEPAAYATLSNTARRIRFNTLWLQKLCMVGDRAVLLSSKWFSLDKKGKDSAEVSLPSCSSSSSSSSSWRYVLFSLGQEELQRVFGYGSKGTEQKGLKQSVNRRVGFPYVPQSWQRVCQYLQSTQPRIH